ncbi:MAG: phosphodiester glycosidase family protein [Bacteroidales bacterium]|nr:phosphodiester glycosidase family protein [Bacteroidales bacterium]
MTDTKKDIRDDEIRIIGKSSEIFDNRQSVKHRLLFVLIFFLLAIGGVLFLLLHPRIVPQDEIEGLFESINESEASGWLGDVTTEASFTERIDTLIDGHALILYIPHQAAPHLSVGNPDAQLRKEAILALQAADIRADNREILGEFVIDGKLLSRGVSKKGFCAIIGEEITVGVSDNTPLLTSAIAADGCFFRQYPLVDQGVPVVNKPKGKAVRKALCDRLGQVFVAVSAQEESFGDFARTLALLGVDNAIYLVGGQDAFGWSVDENGMTELFGKDEHLPAFKNESYLLWLP